jgi:hypothetical protein
VTVENQEKHIKYGPDPAQDSRISRLLVRFLPDKPFRMKHPTSSENLSLRRFRIK